jgi:predicted outer membrane repeat protein
MATPKWVEPSPSLAVTLTSNPRLIASSITIDACTFSNNFAQEHGGALYLSRFDTLTISGGQSVFAKNLAKISGSDLYASQSEGNLTMVGI